MHKSILMNITHIFIIISTIIWILRCGIKSASTYLWKQEVQKRMSKAQCLIGNYHLLTQSQFFKDFILNNIMVKFQPWLQLHVQPSSNPTYQYHHSNLVIVQIISLQNPIGSTNGNSHEIILFYDCLILLHLREGK